MEELFENTSSEDRRKLYFLYKKTYISSIQKVESEYGNVFEIVDFDRLKEIRDEIANKGMVGNAVDRQAWYSTSVQHYIALLYSIKKYGKDHISEYKYKEWSYLLADLYKEGLIKDTSNISPLCNRSKKDKDIDSNYFEEYSHDKSSSIVQSEFDILELGSIIDSTGLIYNPLLIQRYAYSLLTKPFVILSGLAGSGKTQLALAFAKAMVEDEEKQMCVVSVGADWTNREPLLGYPNALKDNSYVKPENGVLDLLIESNKPENSSKPYFLILDEMNLSYVERYFADFLSAMESHVNIPLWKGEGYDVPQSVSLPKNLFITGTINVDETTYMFSPKVLDRANVIEFKVSEKDMESFLINAPVVDMSNLNGSASNMAADYVRIASESIEISKEANNVLKEFFKQLKTVNAEFGYRTATEIGRFISLSKDVLAINEAIDAALVQKLLPKLHGSRKKIVPVLKELWKLCGAPNSLEEHNLLDDLPIEINYKLTADKVLRMYRCAIENGFTSFAEA
jgi:5-methylcytosine-specific restriction protein B